MDLELLRDTPPWEWPRDAGKTIRAALGDQRAKGSDRLLAAELAGETSVINDELAAELLAVLGRADEPDELRALAAISLGPVLELGDMDGFDDPDEVTISEEMFDKIRETLHQLYVDTGVPKEVRRRILEASVRAPETWHEDAVRKAYVNGDKEWKLTAAFAMRWVGGFDAQILEALKNTNPEIHLEAVNAAGERGLDAAWTHVVQLLRDASTPKPLLLAAIGAVGGIRPAEAREILVDLADSEDEEIAEAADEALSVAEGFAGEGEGRNGWVGQLNTPRAVA